MTSDESDSVNAPPLWRSVVSGSVGGICATLVGHPFETVKVRMQTGATTGLFRSLYAGVASPLVGVTPVWALAYSSWRAAYNFQDDGRDEVLRSAFAGAFSGLFHTIIKCPVEAIKVVAQNERLSSAAALRKLWTEQGPRGIFRGFGATAMMMTPSTFVFFGTYEWARRKLERDTDLNLNLMARSFLAGGLAGVMEWSTCMPFDSVKTQIQSGAHSSYAAAVRSIHAKHGVAGFYRGFLPVILRAFPANGAAFIGIEAANSALGAV